VTSNEIATLITTIITAVNTAAIVYFAWMRNKPEIKKLDAEGDSEFAEATNLNLEGAKISAQMLLDRINELKGELDTEKKLRKEELAYSEGRRKEELANLESEYSEKFDRMERARRDDVEYFRRRIKDLERESRDYRSWAAKLSKQVVDAKLIPVPFVPTFSDSDIGITAVRPELETGPLSPTDKEKK
jgi:hypothetical protein